MDGQLYCDNHLSPTATVPNHGDDTVSCTIVTLATLTGCLTLTYVRWPLSRGTTINGLMAVL